MANVQEQVEARLDDLRDGVKSAVDNGADKASTAIDALGAQIKKHPMAALAIAFGVGFLAMRLIRR
ncbi:MAG: hypothetical protein QM831_33070 [Kofleriaceae bacterium]